MTKKNKKDKGKERTLLGMPVVMIIVLVIFVIAGGFIQERAFTLTFVEHDYWESVQKRFQNDSIRVPAARGNLLSCDGRVMVTSLPEYRLAMDFVVVDKDSAAQAKAQAWRDSMFTTKLDSIVKGLARIFPDYTEQQFRERLLKGKARGARWWRIYPRKATYLQLVEVKKLPLFRESSLRSGFTYEADLNRKKIYGQDIAGRTLGDVYPDSNAAKAGLELCYDSILRGKDGYSHKQKVRDRFLSFVDVEPQDGHDLQTTIDIRMQDIAVKALKDKLYEIDGAKKGVAIVMEVATGDIKAMVSLTKLPDSSPRGYGFYEAQNDAINALWEPGSTFKTGSMMVAMEDGYITPDTRMDCEHGVYKMHGRNMTDHNKHKGGYGELTVTQILGQSSNIGVSKIIDKYYHDQPEKYVQGLYNIGVGIPLGMPMGANPRVRMPKKEGRQYTNWSKTALAWMSIGYESQVAPISTLAFYNAIANNGRMMRPRFVKAELENGRVVREFPTVVIKEKICSDKTLHNIQTILEKVVSEGLGKKAGNKHFHVSGKTGTAQVAENGSYAGRNYMVTFCGYYPSEAPKYSTIVCIYEHTAFPSGGGQCGPVFRKISQLVMNDGAGREPNLASDSTSLWQPTVAAGNLAETRQLLRMMDVPWREQSDSLTTAWGSVESDTSDQRRLLLHSVALTDNRKVPNVMGMGARDAVLALQQAGLKVKMHGQGRVNEQSIPAGTDAQAGQVVTLSMK